jgi:hypothetical protein
VNAVPARFLTVLQMTPGGLMETEAFDTVDGLYDCAWSEENENILLAASGDGSVKVYDLAAPPMANPLRVFKEHKHEVSTSVVATPSALIQQLHLLVLCMLLSQPVKTHWALQCICSKACRIRAAGGLDVC